MTSTSIRLCCFALLFVSTSSVQAWPRISFLTQVSSFSKTGRQDAASLSSVFAPVADPRTILGTQMIPFDPRWIRAPAVQDENETLPESLTIPDHVSVVEYKPSQHNDEISLLELGRLAREVVQEELDRKGGVAILFSNLHHRIQNPVDFGKFWEGCTTGDDWQPVDYVPFGKGRLTTDNGIDLATNIPHENVLPCHNEMCYNPHPPSKIAFYCLEAAKQGGETLICRNEDISRNIRPYFHELLEQYDGILYKRHYVDATQTPSNESALVWTWQDKCRTDNITQAVEFFRDHLGFGDVVTVNSSTNELSIPFVHPGYRIDPRSGMKLWFNLLSIGFFPLVNSTDGSTFPLQDHPRRLRQLQVDEWRAYRAFKLQPGQWLILDNLRAQHGRLPYEDASDNPVLVDESSDLSTKRTLLTVYVK